ncbi:MAG: glycosyltransferase [Candidatus Binatia bacterium]|nr:glycosyltransferase [Candidatus Binatia bacterium]
MIAVLFGTFNAKHAANVLLAEDLRRAGVEVRTCHQPLWEETRDKHASYFAPAALVGLALRWMTAMGRLTLRFGPIASGAGLVVAGFNGQLDVLLARILARGRRVLFAPLVTITETLVDDRAQYAADSLLGRLFAAVDRMSLRAADVVLVDTRAHGDYLTTRLAVPADRVVVQYLGAENEFAPLESSPLGSQAGSRLRVLGYGSYLPLHGYDVIARAAKLLSPDEGIHFELIGDGPERARTDPLVEDLPHVKMRDWVPYEDLPAEIRKADVVLGIFGSSVKAQMVVPNKVYQAAQVGRAIVTADTPAIREVFQPGESIVAIEPDPAAVVDALRSLATDRDRREALGTAARAAVARLAGPDVRAARLADALGLPTPGDGSGIRGAAS